MRSSISAEAPRPNRANCARENRVPGFPADIRAAGIRSGRGCRATGAAHATRLAVEINVAGRKLRCDPLGLHPAQQRPDARHQFGHGKRLDHISSAPTDSRARAPFLAARRQHDDRQCGASRRGPQTSADFQPRNARAASSRDNKVRAPNFPRCGFRPRLPRRRARRRSLRLPGL